MNFRPSQTSNEWVLMLDAIYGGSQNYAKTPYELHTHLTEVCGIFAKHCFKRKDLPAARRFLPKIFAWSAALLCKVQPGKLNLEDILLRKYPDRCSYCLSKPCSCWSGEKPSPSEPQLRTQYYQNAAASRRSLNDFQLMFKEIYGPSWTGSPSGAIPPEEALQNAFIRLIEEVSEVGESIRFHHLYPENFESELADVLAWWFALASLFPSAAGQAEPTLVEDLLWRTYPGHCPDCMMVPCLCRPGPVRELMSRPIPGQHHRFDSMTSLLSQAAHLEDLEHIESGAIALALPGSCIRVDVDHFKRVNDTYGHAAGDDALRLIASVLRKVVRERDRVYRVGGDEFGILCADYTAEEAAGAMRRACDQLTRQPVRHVARDGRVSEFTVSVSVGVAEVHDAAMLKAAYEAADQAAYASKNAGRGRVSRAAETETRS